MRKAIYLLRWLAAWVRYALRGFKKVEVVDGYTWVRLESALQLDGLRETQTLYKVSFVFGPRVDRRAAPPTTEVAELERVFEVYNDGGDP